MNRRIQRINELIKREISKIILREIDFPKGALVTVTKVETSPDLKNSKIWISVYPEGRSKNIIKILRSQIYNLQQKINKILKMRPVPQIRFLEEKNISQASRVEEILEQIKNF